MQDLGPSHYGTHTDGEWPFDPTRLALDASRWRAKLPEPLCVEIGRRLFLAQLEFSEWIVRRVDKVGLERDRSVSRRSTIEFSIRDDAPTFIDADDRRLRLVPLALMRRRTLVDLDLRDHEGRPITMPGIRLTQQLDESVVLAAAAAVSAEAALDPYVREFIVDAISGPFATVRAAYERFDDPEDERWPAGLRENVLFRAAVNRFRYNFTLYVFLDPGGQDLDAVGRHRLVHLSFNEPTAWTYQTPELHQPSEQSPVWTYFPGVPKRVSYERAKAALGLSPTRFRFQTPGAEDAASYHFEMSVPPGVQIVRAVLLAGRPNDPDRHTSLDYIKGHSPIIGLHAVEVPNGSLCRVHVDLRPPFRGWLSTMLISSLAIVLVVLTITLHWWSGRTEADRSEVITNVVLILVTVSAAFATLVAQRDSGEVGARVVVGIRYLGTLTIALPVFGASALVLDGTPVERNINGTSELIIPHLYLVRAALTSASILAVAACAFIGAAWWLSYRADAPEIIEESPWDMTNPTELNSSTEASFTVALLEKFGFHLPAIGVKSAEGWHTFYEWTDAAQGRAIDALRTSRRPTVAGQPGNCAALGTACATVHHCGQLPLGGSRPWHTLLSEEPQAHGGEQAEDDGL